MDTLPKFSDSYNKVITAYFKDEIKPWDAKFCFCGTLCDNKEYWFKMPCISHNDFMGYTGKDFVRMEQALLYTIAGFGVFTWKDEGTERYETAVFEGMCAALTELENIHKERGEITDVPVLEKRVGF